MVQMILRYIIDIGETLYKSLDFYFIP